MKICNFRSLMLAAFMVSSGFGYSLNAKEITPEKQDTTVQSSRKENMKMLETIVVTAGRDEQDKTEVPLNIDVITEEEIQNSTAENIGDLLAQKSTGHIHKYPGALTTVGIRGFRTDSHGNDLRGKVLILLDDRRAGTGNLAKILTKNVERVEIIRGPAGVQYGSAALGGIVNVITKKGDGTPTVFIEGKAGNNFYNEVGAGLQGKVGKFDFSGSYSQSSVDDYKTADGDTYKNTGIEKLVNYSFNLGYSITPEHHVGVIVTGFDGNKIGNPGTFDKQDEDNYKDSENNAVDFIYDGRTIDRSLSWKTRYFTGEDKDTHYDPKGSNASGYDNDKPYESKTEKKGGQFQIQKQSELGSIMVGYDWLNYKQSTDNHTSTETESTFENGAPFLLGKLKLMDRKLTLTGGLRSDSFKLEYDRNGDSNEESHRHVTKNAGVAFMLLDSLKIRAAYGEGFQVPDADELSADYTSFGKKYSGNKDLDPEKSVTKEAGLDFNKGTLNISLTYFTTQFKDKIESYDISETEKSWKNVGEATISGYESAVSVDVGELMDLEYEIIPYLNLVQLSEYQDEEADEKLYYVSDRQYSYGIRVNSQNGLTGNLNFSYTGKQEIQDWDNGGSRTEKDAFTVADLSITGKVQSDFPGQLTIKGDIKNLTNKDYEYVNGYTMPGQTFTLGVRYEY